MLARTDRMLALFTLTAALAAGCGGISYRYGTGSVRPIAGAESLGAIATEAMDARSDGAPWDRSGDPGVDRFIDDSLREVRQAVGEHLVRAGVVDENSPTLPAPATAADVRRVLAEARAARAASVVFVRFHRADLAPACGSTAALGIYIGLLPWLILDSIPLWSHGGVGSFEVIVASTETGEVLGRAVRTAAFAEHVSAWGCGADGVMHDMLRRSLELALEDVVAQSRSGWPRRSASPLEDVVLAPATRAEGNRVVGLGWTVEVPAGYALEPRDPRFGDRLARLSRSDSERLDVNVAVTSDDESNFASHAYDSFRGSGTLVSESETTVGGHAARRARVTVEGRRLDMLAVAAEGLGFILACTGSDADCDAAFRSFTVTGDVIADGRRSE